MTTLLSSFHRLILAVLVGTLASFTASAWTLDTSEASWKADLTDAEQEKYDLFTDAIDTDNLNPKDAARQAGDTNFKKLSDGSYQIRLSKSNRVRMWIDWKNQICKIVQVGGHT